MLVLAVCYFEKINLYNVKKFVKMLIKSSSILAQQED